MFANPNSLPWASNPTTNHPQHSRAWQDDYRITSSSRFISQQKSFAMSSIPSLSNPYPMKPNQSNHHFSKSVSADDDLNTKNFRFRLGNLSSVFERHRHLTMTHGVQHPIDRRLLENVKSEAPKSFQIRDILKKDHQNSSKVKDHHNQNIGVSFKQNRVQNSTEKVAKQVTRKDTINTYSLNKTGRSINETSKCEISKSTTVTHFPNPSNTEIKDNNPSQRSAFTIPSISGTKENLHYNKLMPNHALRMSYFISGCERTNLIHDSLMDKNINSKTTTSKNLRVSYNSVYRVQSNLSPQFGDYEDTHLVCSSNSFPQSPTASLSAATASSSTSSTSSSSSSSISQLYHNSQDRKKFQCPQCRYLTDRKNNLMRHIITMHQDSGKVLECCGIAFQSKSSLREHNSVFHSGGYRCQICSRNFCRKALLRRHLTVHSGQKDFYCDLCGYATSHKSNLERHQKVHNKRYIGRLDLPTNKKGNPTSDNHNEYSRETMNNNEGFTDVIAYERNMKSSHEYYQDSDHLDEDNQTILDVSISSDDESELDVIDVELPFEQTLPSPPEVDTNKNTTISDDNNDTSKESSSDVKKIKILSHSHRKPNHIPKIVSKRRGFFTTRIHSTHSSLETGSCCDQNNATNQNQIDEHFIGTESNNNNDTLAKQLDSNGNSIMDTDKNYNPRSSNNNIISLNYLKSSGVAEKEVETMSEQSNKHVDGDHNDNLTACSSEKLSASKIGDINGDYDHEKMFCTPGSSDATFGDELYSNDYKRKTDNSSEEIIDITSDTAEEIEREKSSYTPENAICRGSIYKEKADHYLVEIDIISDTDIKSKREDMSSSNHHNTDRKGAIIYKEKGDCSTGQKHITNDSDDFKNDKLSSKYNDIIGCKGGKSNAGCKGGKRDKSDHKDIISASDGFKSDQLSTKHENTGCKGGKRDRDNPDHKGSDDWKSCPPKKSRLCLRRLYSCPSCHREFRNQIDCDNHDCSRQQDRVGHSGSDSVCFDVPISVIALRKGRLQNANYSL